MKFVFASERARLVRERNKYVEDYNARKERYNTQKAEYEGAYNNYASDMQAFISAFLSAELEELPGTKVEVKKSGSRHNGQDTYFIKLSYISNKKRQSSRTEYKYSDYTHEVDGGHLKGISWDFSIYVTTEDRRKEDGTIETVCKVEKVPMIHAEILDSNDYGELKATYDMFQKLDTIDWNTIIDKINQGVPKEEDFVKEPYPGRMDTSTWDSSIKNYNISRIIGKDLWIRVDINREESYDRYNSNNPGVDGDGWVQITSATDKFYIFHWLECTYDCKTDFPKNKIDYALRREYKLKKIYFSPKEPLEYATTRDLTRRQKPDYLADVPEDDE